MIDPEWEGDEEDEDEEEEHDARVQVPVPPQPVVDGFRWVVNGNNHNDAVAVLNRPHDQIVVAAVAGRGNRGNRFVVDEQF